MKNIKIGIKLFGGFLITAFIILLVGLLSIFQQGKLAEETERLGTEELSAVQEILTVKSQAASIASSMRSLLTSYASKEHLEESYQHSSCWMLEKSTARPRKSFRPCRS